ncbi:MAG: baseplate J/gp47 family protein [Prolixibacteraceae bacterium]|nr:baseplate J/gp47 family protein [Prolixibacteraceae bacterium]
MTTETTHKAILTGEGTDQQQRWIDALNPGALNLHDFSLADWMKFAWNFAEKVNYFNAENQKDGNWQDFFISEPQIKTFLDGLETNHSLAPHQTLFICFLKLLDISKERFNQLTQRHLDFYYQNILKIDKRQPVPDQVHVIFELAKNIIQEKIDSGTPLSAGKDAKGNELTFRTTEELVANRISVAQLKNVYHHSEANLKGIKACEKANSSGGLGKPDPTGDLKWYPFGYLKAKYTDQTPELPDARLGFAIASPVLLLNEGLRTIRLKMVFNNAFATQLAVQAENSVTAFLSGEKKWIGPFHLKASGLNKELNLEIELDKKTEPIAAYQAPVHGERYTSGDPVIRFLIDTGSEQGYSFFTVFSELQLKNIQLSVQVNGISGVEIESDLGILNAKKPFMPFGPIPLKNSRFTVKNDEIFRKNWTNLKLSLNWMNTPESFTNQYLAYRDDLKTPTAELFKTGIRRKIHKLLEYDMTADNLIVKDQDYFKASVALFSKGDWNLLNSNQLLFTQNGQSYNCEFTLSNTGYDTSESGRLQLILNQSFLHEMFPRIYAMAMQNDKSTLIPKDPYTPLAESIELSYEASAEGIFNETASSKPSVQLFHEHPFGQNEKPSGVVHDSPVCLLPAYPSGGELYLGLKDAEPMQQVSLLFQIFEGSENPETISFSEGEKLEWSILSANKWMTLTSNHLISDLTDNFLKSGIVKILIPAEASKENTLLAPGLFWLRVRTNKKFDAVCKIIDIRTQAVLARFHDQNNDLSHLTNGLPPQTISALSERKQSVKTVSQPFNSSGGSPVETDQAYYLQTSERLRHKNRAITLWDYEHLILQQFPEIHKVRCLNHTSATSYLAPGNVTLVVIPDIRNKNVFDIYQPRLSRATLNRVQDCINQLNSLHVTAEVINPEYEEVEISLKARFRSGYDDYYYQNVLRKDLTRLLSPWAFERSADLQFDSSLHKSIVINYIEKLDYVDFITDLKIKHKQEFKTSVSPSNPKAILVSAKEHPISVLQEGCSK